MSAWVYPGPRNADRIGLFGQNDAVEFGFINPNQIQMWTVSGQTLNYTFTDSQLPYDTWFHLATVADGNQIRLFINGEPLTVGASYGSSTYNFNIGGGGIYDTAGNQFTGTLDEVAVWDTALDESQIQAHVAAAKTVGGDYAATVLADRPRGYWGLNDTDDTAVNAGIGGAELNGMYVGGTRGVAGPDEMFPGFAPGNTAFAVESPDDGYVAVAPSPVNGVGEFTMTGWVKAGFFTETARRPFWSERCDRVWLYRSRHAPVVDPSWRFHQLHIGRRRGRRRMGSHCGGGRRPGDRNLH